MEQIPDHPAYSRNVLELITVANDYCLTMNKVETLKKKKLIEYLVKVSPLLYLKGTLLPDIKVKNPDMNERFYTEEEWEILFNTLRNAFGEDDIFWFSDTTISDELIKGSIAEQFTDIYQDLQDFLLLYQKNSLDAKENAVHEVVELFKVNWGTKLLRAQFPLHDLFFRSQIPEEEEEMPTFF